MGAVRDDELYARVLGHPALKLRLINAIIVGAIAGLGGALYAHAIRFIDPNSFFVHQTVFILSMVYLSGLGSLRGTLFSAFLMTFLPEVIRFLPLIPAHLIGSVRTIFFSTILLFVVIERPRGLDGKIELAESYADGD